jgi:hypothetical protein
MHTNIVLLPAVLVSCFEKSFVRQASALNDFYRFYHIEFSLSTYAFRIERKPPN